MQSLAGASPARGYISKRHNPHTRKRWSAVGLWFYFLVRWPRAISFWVQPAFTAVGVFTVSTADIIPTVGAVFLFSPCNCIRLTAYSTNVRRADAAAQRLYIPSDSRRNKRMCSGHSPFSQRCKGAQRDEVTGGELRPASCRQIRGLPLRLCAASHSFSSSGTCAMGSASSSPQRDERGSVGYECVMVGGSNRFAPKGVELVVGHVFLPP